MMSEKTKIQSNPLNTKEIFKIIKQVSLILGKPLTPKEIEIIDAGCPHKQPSSLDENTAAVYCFALDEKILKIGKANKKSSARFVSQHYGFSAPSTLAKSLYNDHSMKTKGLPNNKKDMKKWMLNNLHRIDIIIKCNYPEWATTLIEGILHYKYNPLYEGNIIKK